MEGEVAREGNGLRSLLRRRDAQIGLGTAAGHAAHATELQTLHQDRPTQLLFPIFLTCTPPKAVCCSPGEPHLSPLSPQPSLSDDRDSPLQFLRAIPVSRFIPLSETQTQAPFKSQEAGCFQSDGYSVLHHCPPNKTMKKKRSSLPDQLPDFFTRI